MWKYLQKQKQWNTPDLFSIRKNHLFDSFCVFGILFNIENTKNVNSTLYMDWT